MAWDFSKLPKEKHSEVIELFEKRDMGKLMVIHNTYKLSDFFYCCGTDGNSVLNWFKFGIEHGEIKQG
jgi:hypothetical protein